jgi:hypothetical protein
MRKVTDNKREIERLFSPREAARISDRTVRTIHRYRREGLLGYYMLDQRTGRASTAGRGRVAIGESHLVKLFQIIKPGLSRREILQRIRQKLAA